MNSLLVVCVLSVVYSVSADDWKPIDPKELQKITQDCIISSKATKADLTYIEKDLEPSTTAQACLITCFYQKLDMAEKNGTMHVDKTVKALELMNDPPFYKPEDFPNLKKLLTTCNAAQPKIDDECQAIKAYIKCYITKAPEFKVPLNL